MKSLKYLAIACAVAGVAMTAAPAEAGSVSAKGGSVKVDTKYNDTYSSHTTNIDNSTTKSDTKKVYGANSADVTNYSNGDNITRTGKERVEVTVKSHDDISGKVTTVETKKYDSKSQAKDRDNIKKMACDGVKKGRSGYNLYNVTCKNGDNVYANYSGGKYSWFGDFDSAKYKKAVDNAKAHKDGSARKVGTEITNKKSVVKEKLVGSKTEVIDKTKIDTKVDTTVTEAFKSQTYTCNDGSCILIGDTDNIGNAYAAQGTTKVETEVDRHTHTETTNTKTGTLTNLTTETWSKYNYITGVKHNVYEQDYVYKVDMTVDVSPIVLDLDGDGKIEASNGKYLPHEGDFSKNVVMFDFYGNGFPVAMEWVGTNDGLLCRPNADGSVKGINLFGTANGYENGYDELTSLDANKDGVLTGAELNGLMVWQDENHNGVADQGELKSLESLGITSIGATHNNLTSTYTRNGQIFKSFDWYPSVKKLRKIDVAR